MLKMKAGTLVPAFALGREGERCTRFGQGSRRFGAREAAGMRYRWAIRGAGFGDKDDLDLACRNLVISRGLII